MNSTPHIFKERLINGRLSHFTKDDVPYFDKKFHEITLWHTSCTEKDLEKTKETSVQGLFMTRLFQGVFGYLEIVDEGDCYNQLRESKTVLDTTESDGALGFFYKSTDTKDVRVVIELKDAKTPLDKKQNRSSHLTPVEQAFSYANKNGSKCGWVIVSNFIETRLYKSTSSLEYEIFDMTKMDDEKEFLRFYFFMCKDNLISEHGKSVIDELYVENEAEGVDISNKFYKDYKQIRNNLFAILKENNPDKNELLLFTKTQKLMDRFTFICFCEDCNLLPQNVYQKLIDNAKNSFSFSSTKLWEQLKGLFASIDKGNPPMKINRYNGGLFKTDEELDALIIPDDVLESFTKLSSYDFNSDLNVNILGQIFEQSISDVEQIKEEISGVQIENGKQKDDGIFYTPYYVTRYIVEQTVGAFLSRRKEELKHEMFKNGAITVEVVKPSTGRKNTYEFTSWVEIPIKKENMTEDEIMAVKFTKELHRKYWLEYENVLKKVKICDPACGSGAFLNQCFDYLHEEMDFVLDMRYQFDGQRSIFDIDKEILQNNLYGVDINPESVEITKLSLWLKTAKSNQTLATLDENIKCGNSIVDDNDIADNAFDWKKEFSDVYANGGFDVIVGNPPYGAKLPDEQKKYVFDRYKSTQGGVDTYKTFFELGLSLLKENGYLGFITPNTFLLQDMSSKLREILFVDNTFRNLVEIYNVFPNAVVEPVISIFKKEKPRSDVDVEVILVPRKTKLTSTFVADGETKYISTNTIKQSENYVFRYKMDDMGENVLNTLYDDAEQLGEHFKVTTGIELYGVGKGIPPQTKQTLIDKPFTSFNKIDDTWIPLIRGTDLYKYATVWHGEYVKYGEWLRVPKNKELFAREKLFIRRTGDYPLCCYDNDNYIPERASHALYKADDYEIPIKYILGLLNSKLIRWVFRYNNSLLVGKPLAQVNAKYIERLPLKYADVGIEDLVDELIDLYKQKIGTIEKFLYFIEKTYGLEKTSEKLQDFSRLSFAEFLSELSKKKVKIQAKEKMELLPLFEDNCKCINEVLQIIETKESLIDKKLCEIYNLSEQQIDYMNNY